MNFDEYVKGIDFRLHKPHQRLRWYFWLSDLLSILNISLETANTKLPDGEREMREKLGPLCSIPKMSTFAIGAIINRAVSCMPDDTCFVNVGVWNGFTLLAGMVGNDHKNCIGVDNFSQFGDPKDQFLKRFEKYSTPYHHFYELSYVDYFSRVHAGLIGLYVYDGEHSYNSQMNGLKIAEAFFSEGCIILIDDTNFREPREATLDFIRSSVNQYEILLDKTTSFNGNPTFWNGVMILRTTTR